jgi:hypothetical protein
LAVEARLIEGGLQAAQTIAVIRIDPWSESVAGIHPSNFATITTLSSAASFGSDEAIVQLTDSDASLQWEHALDSIQSSGCSEISVRTLNVAWALLFFDYRGRKIGSVFLQENGLCAASATAVSGADPHLVQFLRRTFSFLNY